MMSSNVVPELLAKAYHHPMLNEEDLVRIAAMHHRVLFEKGATLLGKGRTANEYYILDQGLVRSFVFDFDGNEITTEFFAPGEIVIVPVSLFQRQPSQETMHVVADSVLWKIDFEDFQQLFHQIKGFTEWGRLWFTMQLFATKQRSLDMITETATHRYLKLLEQKPEIIRYAPLKQIASYLGITDTSLSRIRKEIATE